MNHYSPEMRSLRDSWFEEHPEHDNNTYYLFVVPQFDDPEGIQSYSDVYIEIGSRIIHIETKAGDSFFEFVNTSGSNFSSQSFNMLRDATSIEDVKWPLNNSVKTSLDDPAIFAAKKQQVIDAWINWEGGKIVDDEQIWSKFADYYNESIFSSTEFVAILENNNEWFNIMFRSTSLSQ